MIKDQSRVAVESNMAHLISRAVRRDFAAFGEVYAFYLERVYRYIYYQVRDKMTAEDLTEDVFLKAWKAMKSYRGDEKAFLPWLYRIARNLVIDTARREKRNLPLFDNHAVPDNDPEETALHNMNAEEMQALIATLPPRARQVIILKFIEGMNNKEIAQITGQKPVAIRIMQMRALSKLRQLLTREVSYG